MYGGGERIRGGTFFAGHFFKSVFNPVAGTRGGGEKKSAKGGREEKRKGLLV